VNVRRAILLALGAATIGCLEPAGPAAAAADLRGTWRFTAAQDAPSLQLTGSLVIASQQGDLITGSISWEERDPSGATRLEGGAVTGRVIEQSDVDFDVLLGGGTRRHVARLLADTMSGSWLQVGGGGRGEFRAVRGTAGIAP